MSDEATVVEAPLAAPKLKALVAQKVGMTQVYDAQGHIAPVTVLQAGPCAITQIMTKEKHGYAALQVTFGDIKEKSVNKPMAGHFKKANVPRARWVREFRTDNASDFQVGQTLRVDSFSPGDFVDISGYSKGHGFSGAMKRHNFAGGPATHGQSDRQRAPGSSGSNTYPGRVFKGKRFPGHFGVEMSTVQHLEVVEVILEKDLLLVRGTVPGPTKALVTVEQTVKRVKIHKFHTPEHKEKVAKKEAAKAAAPAKGKGGK